jgi:hypothetical protein
MTTHQPSSPLPSPLKFRRLALLWSLVFGVWCFSKPFPFRYLRHFPPPPTPVTPSQYVRFCILTPLMINFTLHYNGTDGWFTSARSRRIKSTDFFVPLVGRQTVTNV